MQDAIKYSPTDPTSLYLLAEWHYSCYNVSWAERQVAKMIFGTLPEPDLEEALSKLICPPTFSVDFPVRLIHEP